MAVAAIMASGNLSPDFFLISAVFRLVSVSSSKRKALLINFSKTFMSLSEAVSSRATRFQLLRK